MKKLKVLTLVGTRPEIIKLSLTLLELDKSAHHVIVHTGQNFDYELNEVFFKDLNLRKPDYFLNAAGTTPAETIANVISKFDEVLSKEVPDAVLIYGDTNSCLGAIAAKRRKIPIFHMEAGNRCFDQRVPEEINRKIIDHISDVNIIHSEHARRYLLNEGLRPDLIFKSGSPMAEVLEVYRGKVEKSQILQELQLLKEGYFLASAHREENVDNDGQLLKLINSLKDLSLKYKLPVIFSTHPRTRKRIDALKIDLENVDIRFLKPFGFFDYLHLQKNAKCTLSDSGTLTEESALLNFPGVMIREVHERPEGMDEARVVMSGLDSESIQRCVDLVLASADLEPIKDYSSKNVSKKVVRWIYSYIPYVNRMIWKKG